MPEEIAEGMGITVERVRGNSKIAQEPVSLETPIGEEERFPFRGLHRGTKMQLLQTMQLVIFYCKEQIEDVFTCLTDREQQVLILRFGLKDGKPSIHWKKLVNISMLTRERISSD